MISWGYARSGTAIYHLIAATMSSELKTVDVKKLVLQTLYKTINTRVHYNQQQ